MRFDYGRENKKMPQEEQELEAIGELNIRRHSLRLELEGARPHDGPWTH
jgi:hypothetical protein